MLVNIGKGIELTVPGLDTLSPEVRDHIVYLGWRNVLMDSHAGMTAKDNPTDYVEKSRAIAEKKLAALTNGEVRTTSFRESDPVKARAQELITKALLAKYRSEGKKPDAKDCAKEAKTLLANAKPDNKFMIQARKDVEASRALTADLDDLM
jgi:hypothetical protein